MAPPDATIWRFMDFTKYVSMLHRRALFFTRADNLPDPFEGMQSKVACVARRTRAAPEDALRQSVFLSCWHENEHESAAMWRIYLSSEEGVAVRSSVARLRAALSDSREPLHFGKVRYLDYERETPAAERDLDAFFCKRKSFDYERELRVLWRRRDALDQPGHYVAADLERLVDAIVVSPTSEPWFEELVSSVTGKYGLELPITMSSMRDVPG
jgi:hypothetical protein